MRYIEGGDGVGRVGEFGLEQAASPLKPEYVRDGILQALSSPPPADAPALFGDGNAAGKIAAKIAGR